MTDRTDPAAHAAPVYTGGLPDASRQAAAARRYGWWLEAEHQLRSMRAYAAVILTYSVGQPLLYLVAMGLGIGSLVDGAGRSVDGVRYLVFVAPALMVATAVQSTANELTYPVMDGFKWHRLYYAPLASPLTARQIALGHAVAVLLRMLLQAVVFWGLMVAFGATAGAWSLLAVPVTVLCCAAFGLPLQAFAASRDDEGGAFAFVHRFVVMPLFLFSGTFYPLSVMPAYLQPVGWISPIWHATQLARAACYGMALTVPMALVHIGFLCLCVGAGWLVCARLYQRRLVD